MELRQFGVTALYVMPVVFGAWQVGGPPFFSFMEEKDAVRLIEGCYDLGVNFFDTAPVYGFGRSEEYVGKALHNVRTKAIISTKCGLQWKDETFNSVYKHASKESVLKEAEQSLRRLNTDYIDLYLVHWPDESTPIEETLEAFYELQRSGKIRFYGFSNFSLKQLEEAQLKGAIISGVQSQYSMLNTKLEKGGELQYCISNEIGVQAYSPLHRGILTDKTVEAMRDSGQLAIDWILNALTDRQIEQVQKIREIASSYDAPFSSFVINWTISQLGITTAIVGTTKIENMKAAIEATKFNISEEDIQAVRQTIFA